MPVPDVSPVRRCDAAERRARLAQRQALARGFRGSDVLDVARRLVCLHGTDPSTVYLSAAARVDGMSVADLDAALYRERSLVKHLAMRRTLFVFPTDRLDVAQSAASQRVADRERARLSADVEKAGLHADGAAWLAKAEHAVLQALADGRELTSSQLRDEVPLLEGAITYGEGRTWGGQVPVGPRVLTCLSAAGLIVRASNDGLWTASRPRWATVRAWIGRDLDPPAFDQATARMVTWWLRAFGPGTAADLKWWLGSTLSAVRRALRDVEASVVDLDGEVGYVLPDDVEPVHQDAPWSALLPALDPTSMAWAGPGRRFFLGDHQPLLFDSNGNAGPTAWWCGQVVGGWRQHASGEVELQLLQDVGAEGEAALREDADRLSAWLDGRRVLPRFPSPLFNQQ